MNWIQSVILGVIQGITEFLPISSSGHLALAQNIFGLKEPELLFDICLHIGTLAAVITVFYNEIKSVVSTLGRLSELKSIHGGFKAVFQRKEEVKTAVFIIVGTIATGIVGILLQNTAKQFFSEPWMVGLMLIVTGYILWSTRFIKYMKRRIVKMSIFHCVTIGIIQGIAVLPGISRSGATISAALLLGIDREKAARYSFLLSIPAIMGALILEFDFSIFSNSVSMLVILAGSLTSAIVGYAALKILLKIVGGGQLSFFAPYCWLLGIAVLWRSLVWI